MIASDELHMTFLAALQREKEGGGDHQIFCKLWSNSGWTKEMASSAACHVADTNVSLAGLCIPCPLTSRAFTFVTLQLLLVTALWACAACNVFTSHLFKVLLPMIAGPR